MRYSDIWILVIRMLELIEKLAEPLRGQLGIRRQAL